MNTYDNNEIANMDEIAKAIIVQACDDYRDALRGNCDKPDEMIEDVMKFFKSHWYEMLTKVSYQYLLEKLDAEWEEGKKLIAVGLEVDCPKLKKHYTFTCPLCGGWAEVYATRHQSPKRKDGSRRIKYYKSFTCSCHRPERILLKQEVVYEEN